MKDGLRRAIRMHERRFSFRSTFLVVGFLLATNASAQPPTSSARFEVNLDDLRPLSQDLHGANNEYFYPPVWFDHPAYSEKYLAAGRPFFRYPGGTGSNFYNPFTGLFDNDSPSTRDYTGLNRRIAQRNGGTGRVPADFFEFVREHDIRYSLVLNVCTQTFEQNRAWLEQIADQGHPVTMIEIGNEVFYGSYKWAFASGDEYVTRAKKLTAVIRELMPDTKVGVVIPNQLYQYDAFFSEDIPDWFQHPYSWITALQDQTFYDAVVIHLYSPNGMSNDVEPADFISHLDAYTNCDAHLTAFFDRTFDEIETKFPGKRIWITEYGVGGFGGNLKQYTLRYSHLGVLHADVMLLRFINRPSVSMTQWHSFQHFWDFVGGEKGIGDEEHLPYKHFALFRDAIRNSQAVADVKGSAMGSDSAIADAIESAALIGEETAYVILINRSGQEHIIENPTFVRSGEVVDSDLTEAVQLSHRSDMPLRDAMQNTERSDYVERTTSQLRPIHLPSYSITRLKLTFANNQEVAGAP